MKEGALARLAITHVGRRELDRRRRIGIAFVDRYHGGFMPRAAIQLATSVVLPAPGGAHTHSASAYGDRRNVSRAAPAASSSDSKICAATPRLASVSPSLARMNALVVKRVTPSR
jgi:hypothetical protein